MKIKKYLILYYFCFVITLVLVGFSNYHYLKLTSLEFNGDFFPNIIDSILYFNPLIIINLILFIVFTILIIIKKELNGSLTLSISYIGFAMVFIIMCLLFNNRVIVNYIHFNYYLKFLLIGYLFLNIYSLLCIKFKN